MKTPEELFEDFTQTYGIEDPTDRDRAFFFGALATTRKHATPAAWAPIDAHGLPTAVFDSMPQTKRPATVPLYRDPLTHTPKPPLTDSQIHTLATAYYPDDLAGLCAYLYRYYTS